MPALTRHPSRHSPIDLPTIMAVQTLVETSIYFLGGIKFRTFRLAAAGGALHHFQYRRSIAGKKNDLGTLNVFDRTGVIADDPFKTHSIGGVQKDADGLTYEPRPALLESFASPTNASMH